MVLVLREDTYVAPPPEEPQASGVPAGAASAALDRLADSLGDGDRGAARALAAPGRGARLAALTGNARRLRIESLSFRYVDEVSAVDGAGRWTAATEATWRYGGVDVGTARAEVEARLVAEDGTVRIIGFAQPSEGGRLPPWLGGSVTVARSADTLVVAARGIPVERYRRTARRAVPQVRRVLPEWSGPLVVDVPRDTVGLGAAIAGDPDSYASVAGVTATADGREAAGAPVHVFVNPDVFGELGAQGAQVVMTHEAVHVATGATSVGPRGALPVWLREGFADYVALRDVALPARRTAAQAIAQVRDEGLPSALPGNRAFDATADQFGAAYEASWLACRVIARAAGEDALVSIYEDVSSGRDLEAALRDHAGLSVARLTREWRGVLADLADGPVDGGPA